MPNGFAKQLRKNQLRSEELFHVPDLIECRNCTNKVIQNCMWSKMDALDLYLLFISDFSAILTGLMCKIQDKIRYLQHTTFKIFRKLWTWTQYYFQDLCAWKTAHTANQPRKEFFSRKFHVKEFGATHNKLDQGRSVQMKLNIFKYDLPKCINVLPLFDQSIHSNCFR